MNTIFHMHGDHKPSLGSSGHESALTKSRFIDQRPKSQQSRKLRSAAADPASRDTAALRNQLVGALQRLVAFALAAALVAGCTMIPKYKQPPANTSSSWPSVPGYAKTKTAPAAVPAGEIGWHDFFRDPKLQQVINMALTNNPSLRAAVENVVQYRALYHVQFANLIPVVNVNASGSRQRQPNFFGANGTAITYNEYQLNLGVESYELDLFGRVRSLNHQALETYFAKEEAQRAAQIALVAQVATAYLTQQEAAEQLAIARETLNAARQSFDLTKRSFEAGVSSQFDLNTASTQLSTASASVATYAQQLAEASDNLALLVGRPLPPELQPATHLDLNLCLSDIPAGLPSDLLEQRPDVLEAEHTLKSDNANIGAARAAFFPKITLTGNGGYASGSLQTLIEPASTAWNFSPQLVWPVFALGTAYHQLQADRAIKEADAANYQSTIQTAFKEVADALAVRQTVESQLADNEALVKSDQQSYDLTKAGFDSGVNSTLDVLVTLQTLNSARQNLIQTQYSRLTSLINLYQALGGGWNEYTPRSEQEQASKE